jgi:hypothetical protein
MRSVGRAFASALPILSCYFSLLHAGWIENGTPLTFHRDALATGVIVSDGLSGAVIAFRACHDGFSHIIAQRVDSLGIPLWGGAGIEICTAPGEQQCPQIAPDGGGGAIVTWQDNRSGSWDIYAQRVDGSGAVLWSLDGLAVCTALGTQQNPQIVSEGMGGASIVWQDNRGGNWDIYAQQVDAPGTVRWTSNGVAICIETKNQQSPRVRSDGAGGAVVAWYDLRGSDGDVYAQRVTASGLVQWAANGIVLCMASGEQSSPTVVSDGSGGAIVTWFDYRSGNWDIYAQRVNAAGSALWAANGVGVCTVAGDQVYPMVVSDLAAGAVVTWMDHRGGSSYDVYAQRVNAAGAAQWTANGVALCTAPSDQYVGGIVSDGPGSAIVAWIAYRSGNYYDVCAQKVNAGGAVQWSANGVTVYTTRETHLYPEINPQVTSDNAGGAIITWYDARSGNSAVCAQSVSASGALRWAASEIVLCPATVGEWNPSVVSDSSGGAIITWQDARSGSSWDIYVQRVNAEGVVQWTAYGVELCGAAWDQQNPMITSDGEGGAIATWQDFRWSPDIYAQRVNAAGSIQWTADGVALCAALEEQESPTIASDGLGGAIVAWCDKRSGNADIYVQKVDASGTVEWTADGVALCTATGMQVSPMITPDGAGGAIVAWQDNRRGQYEYPDIYAQRVNASGVVLWMTDGVGICTMTGEQDLPAIISDGAGGAIVAWEDYRGGNYDIFAQRVNAAGATQWTTDGIALCTATGYQQVVRITSDGGGGAIVTWQDYRSGLDIYAQRVNAAGNVQWTTDGVALCTAPGEQESPGITSDGAGGAIITWYDGRDGHDWNIYAQRVGASGDVQWESNGVAISTASGAQVFPTITSDRANGGIVVWADQRCKPLIYAQRIRGSGEIVGTLLRNYSAALDDASIRLSWTLSEIDEGARFFISRASAPGWEYVELEGAGLVRDGLSFTFIDGGGLPGTTYKYRVECEASGAPRKLLFETEAITIPPRPATLYQNRPNPFNPSTVIRFYLPEAQEITLDIYDVVGARVARLAEGKREKGYHEVAWDGRNGSGEACASGVYFSRLRAGKSTIARKMVIAR